MKLRILRRILIVIVGIAVLAGVGLGAPKVIKHFKQDKSVASEAEEGEKLQAIADKLDYDYLGKIAYIMPDFSEEYPLDENDMKKIIDDTLVEAYVYKLDSLSSLEEIKNYSIVLDQDITLEDKTLRIFDSRGRVSIKEQSINEFWKVAGLSGKASDYYTCANSDGYKCQYADGVYTLSSREYRYSDVSYSFDFEASVKRMIIDPKRGCIGVYYDMKRQNSEGSEKTVGKIMVLEPKDTATGYCVKGIFESDGESLTGDEQETIAALARKYDTQYMAESNDGTYKCSLENILNADELEDAYTADESVNYQFVNYVRETEMRYNLYVAVYTRTEQDSSYQVDRILKISAVRQQCPAFPDNKLGGFIFEKIESINVESEKWQEEYVNHIVQVESDADEDFTYQLIHLDDDDVPELVYIGVGSWYHLAFYNGTTVEDMMAGNCGINYIERTGYFSVTSFRGNFGGSMGHVIYQLKDGKIEGVAFQSNSDLQNSNWSFQWGDESVTEEEFETRENELFTEQTKEIDDLYEDSRGTIRKIQLYKFYDMIYADDFEPLFDEN